jgi:hypothetical protein
MFSDEPFLKSNILFEGTSGTSIHALVKIRSAQVKEQVRFLGVRRRRHKVPSVDQKWLKNTRHTVSVFGEEPEQDIDRDLSERRGIVL